MGFLDKLFGKNNTKNAEASTTTKEVPTPILTEEGLLEQYGGIALEKQLDFGELIGDNNWNVDMTAGTISFGDSLSFPLQVLGTFSHSSETWLWAWANQQSDLPDSIQQNALQLKKYGDDNDFGLLRNPRFDFSTNELHILGIIATGLCHADAYYIADYGQGAMLLTITDSRIKQVRHDIHDRVRVVFPQLISQFEIDHQNALRSYLRTKGYTIEETKTTLTATKDSDIIRAEFDDLSRLTNLQG
ncbi:DUF6882 domain-containing protein [Sphingobacterium paucimobilis]|uniref:Uncharacterized protein n=1 Tax=Sphingobacterium paucimobilis HER1398 TaxID=1346330 RepID=U2IXP7_9SPHI|nr:DUF6882 domain-containing protein [Sphingobacterium paucimobilis]ERJ57474.1 hypothetical protein M472_01715 [Sphingobacterium paucimobilis HER1398]